MSAVIRGFRMDKAALEAERAKFESEPFVVPAQRIETQAFPQAATETALKTSQNIALHKVTDFMLIFPKSAQQITCFENPMLQNLQLTTCGNNYPERAVSTIDNVFFQQQLAAADLAAFGLEPNDEWEDSLTIPRAHADGRIRPLTDLTSFVITIPVERNSGAGIYFDGLDTEGQNVSVELRANPIYQGVNDTYYRWTGNTTPNPPPPVLATVQDTFWIFSSRRGGMCVYETDKSFNEVVGSM